MMDPRLDFLEGRVEEQSRNWDRLFGEIGRLDRKIDARIDAVDQKFDRKIDELRADLMKQFRWTIGVMVTLSMGLLAAILTR
jgi:tetrahydromethanopterin S-methyltransferase subunit G